MSRLRIAVHGAAGRMGRRIIALASRADDLQVVAALERPGHPELGTDAGTLAGVAMLGVPVQDDLSEPVDVLIDFSTPEGTGRAVQLCRQHRIGLVLATTGLPEPTQEAVRELARAVPVLWAPNLAITVVLAMQLVERAAEALRSRKDDLDVEIIEQHHRYKEDAPSGTALQFGRRIAQVLQIPHSCHGRHGRTGPRPRDQIGYHAVRCGDDPGQHTILFGLTGERLAITVQASNRDCYAAGALAAARFLAGQGPGLYRMDDLLPRS